MKQQPSCSLPEGLALGGPVSDGRKCDRVTPSKIFFSCGWTFLGNCCPRVPPLIITLVLSGVLVNQLGVGGSDLRHFPWFRYSYFDYQPDVTEYGGGKT